MRLAFVPLVVAAGILALPHANAIDGRAASPAPIFADGSRPSAAANDAEIPGPVAKIAVTNADDTLAHWATCVQPDCHPGGKGIPVSTDQTIGHASPSVDGASMLVTETLNSPKFFTNVLWDYHAKACDDCTQMHTDFWIYPVSSSHVGTLEYDAFLFDGTRRLNITWGMQWNQRRGVWQVWNQGTNRWVDTDITTGPNFGAWNHLQFAGHRVIGDTGCDGTECLDYDSLTLNGTTYTLNIAEPAGPIHPGWHAVSGFQFQLDAAAGELHAYDEQGRHTGLALDPKTGYQYLQKEIPDATYMSFGAGIYFMFPSNTSGRIEIRGLEDISTFVGVFYGDAHYGYPLTLHKGSIATIPIVFSQSKTSDRVDVGPLKLDINGDGTIDQIIHGIAF